MSCEKCKNGKCENVATVSKATFVLSVEKEKAKTSFWKIMAIIAIIACFVSNFAWLIYRTSLEKVTETTTTTETYTINQEAEGTNNSIINGGDIVNGKAND